MLLIIYLANIINIGLLYNIILTKIIATVTSYYRKIEQYKDNPSYWSQI